MGTEKRDLNHFVIRESKPNLTLGFARETRKMTIEALNLDKQEIEKYREMVDRGLALAQELIDTVISAEGEKDPVLDKFGKRYYRRDFSFAKKLDSSFPDGVMAEISSAEKSFYEQIFILVAIELSDLPYQIKGNARAIYYANRDRIMEIHRLSPVTNKLKEKFLGKRIKSPYGIAVSAELFEEVVRGLLKGPSDLDPVDYAVQTYRELSRDKRLARDIIAIGSLFSPRSKEEYTNEELETMGQRRIFFEHGEVVVGNVLNKNPQKEGSAKEIRDYFFSVITKAQKDSAKE